MGFNIETINSDASFISDFSKSPVAFFSPYTVMMTIYDRGCMTIDTVGIQGFGIHRSKVCAYGRHARSLGRSAPAVGES